ncbi:MULTISPECIES: radical SAM protein [unclassified Campylobacter]|uniref:radical SAM protein n=1 Tax=unclassified Campylobacter TaxID=2593542 RepID=UPI001237E036|nr:MULTISPECIES: radical SAM protein [unclassified Campylobacter]KAA6227192.1 radical SAM protein [Campylobacter sp. LR286c]KAA6227934.1 radical SAM protein [Campylobacter sp. LR185c]KAA6228343.1 radical SAM protein [Campylobacter sp. LR196d]KAA6229344.1 radical SAM protein [Campylobacter sp. LR291e]KAA6231150.1 radical SAM protein [Campylobacter sp. LR264d]
MKLVFGPVNSRRFGLSLGVDLSPFTKQCNFDCVYCELSPKKPMIAQNQVVEVDEILKQINDTLKSGVEFDFLTLTANGEPSLYPHLKELILSLKKSLKNKKILILSNGTAVLDENKFNTLLLFDVVKFSLDSAIQKTFYRIDRALKEINLELLIKKMADFQRTFKGELVMEILVVKGLNDNEKEFLALNKALAKIKPLRVDISSIDRPPAYAVKRVSEERLNELATLINSVPVLIAKRTYNKQSLEFSKEELLKSLHLRPQSELDINALFSDKSKQNLELLIKEEKIKILDLAGIKFYKA